MICSRLGLVAVVVLMGASWRAAAAQSGTPFKRPKLAAGADTNDARAYYDFGVANLRHEPWKAAAAFYWASRLEPGWSDPFYAQRVAGLLARENILIGYLEGVRSVVVSRDAQRLDSLEYQAQRLNPFFVRGLDETLFAGYVMGRYKRTRSRQGELPLDPADRSEVEFLVDQVLRSGANAYLRAALAASRGRVIEALEFNRQLLSQVGDKGEIHADRAKLFYRIGSYDSALVELQAAAVELRHLDTTRLIRVYVSQELMEHAIGLIHEAAGDTAAARQAYGRALQENLGYAPAHALLAGLDLAAGDRARALSEFDVAVEVAPTDAPLRVAYGVLLAKTGRRDDAVIQLRRAAELEPFYAMPHYVLGYVGELQGNREEALAGYRGFLARASARDLLRKVVATHVTDLSP